MDIPPLHVCQALTSENEIIHSKYKKLTRKYKELQKQMLELQEKLTRMQIEKEYSNQGMSTVASKVPLKLKAEVAEVKQEKDPSTHKLLVLHNKLLKQFEKETKQSGMQAKKLRKLENDTEKLKDELFNAGQQVEFLKKQLQDKDTQLQLVSSKINNNSQSKQDCTKHIKSFKKEKDKLLTENRKLKDELKGLDRGFFEEIEDTKYALQQSAKLNTEYEKALRRLCKQFGLNYNTALLSKSKEQDIIQRERMRSFDGNV